VLPRHQLRRFFLANPLNEQTYWSHEIVFRAFVSEVLEAGSGNLAYGIVEGRQDLDAEVNRVASETALGTAPTDCP
jgi:hypothetical protein